MSGATTAIADRLRRAALGYAAHGRAVFPLRPRSKEPIHKGGFHNATTDAAQVEDWWDKHHAANIGLAPGASGVVIIDVDGPAGEEAAIGFGLCAEPTLTCITGRAEGGRHLYYSHPGFHVGNQPLADHLDVRGDVGYGILPPSIHPSGRRYQWDRTTTDILSLPAKPREALRALQDGNGQRGRLELSDLTDRLRDGVRHETLKSWIGHWMTKLSVEEVTAIALAVNAHYGKPATDESEILQLIEWTAQRQASSDADPTRVIPLSDWKRRRGAA